MPPGLRANVQHGHGAMQLQWWIVHERMLQRLDLRTVRVGVNSSCGSGGAACIACAAGQACNLSTGQCVGRGLLPKWLLQRLDLRALRIGVEHFMRDRRRGLRACAAGQESQQEHGTVVCDATSCPNGCCSGSTCVPYASEWNSSCGTGGAACAACASGQE